MKLGVFGGSFDPFHSGHAELIRQIFKKNIVERLELLPSYSHPFKTSASHFPFELRCQMVEAFITQNKDLENKVFLNQSEKILPKPNYTLQTLNEIRSNHPDAKIYFFIGSDNISLLHLWHGVNELFNQYHICCFYRKGSPFKDAINQAQTHLTPKQIDHLMQNAIDVSLPNVSSTQIRNLIEKNDPSVKNLIPAEVLALIK